MSEVRWRLKEFLAERNLTAYALSKEGGIHRLSTVYRITGSDAPTRVDLPTLAKVLDGLRKLTGEDVQIGDILEYLPDGK
ncbi:helix-turn-helix domain-containing protein [Deinococcus radiodurans]|jgi:DNA-binding Xre family transcriptional regulator|uniref:helix-turn-helix domain-containing protein n=1 Tax=Deinococcus radiodurans TaxID=1299 RepID=UPI0009DEC206|nr:helix-turn-helix transcriptional regulator [Deinococcus radiodurans]UDL02291.1 XRE family transcriptional regulator [Deinococcus radiodurans R1 = ATCC 13939 = DSM 20539]UID72098.1 hypothetical protein DRO_C0023 [Deinococcus radiodurans R1 = ATCC 13939 = DSM 20539]